MGQESTSGKLAWERRRVQALKVAIKEIEKVIEKAKKSKWGKGVRLFPEWQ